MEKKFKSGDKVICPSIEILTEVHDLYWPHDIHRDDYLKDLGRMVGKIYTIDTLSNLGSMWLVSIIEGDNPINRWKKPQELFELYYKHEDNENIPSIFGMASYLE